MHGEEEIAVKKRQFEQFLQNKGSLVTSQRRAIAEAALRSTGPVHADELLKRAREHDRSISLYTVQRTLRLLTESGLLGAFGSRKDFKFYDPKFAEQPHRCHILYEDCGEVLECNNPKVNALEEGIVRKRGFTFQSKRTGIRVACNEFRKFGSCKKQCSS